MELLKPIEWEEKGIAKIIDQRLLPETLEYEMVDTVEKMYVAIKELKVRGAPLIGISAAYGLCVAMRDFPDKGAKSDFMDLFKKNADYLASSRPTAVNLFWAIDRMSDKAAELVSDTDDIVTIKNKLIGEAKAIHEEDIAMGRKIGEYGYEELKKYNTLQTHCNAGGLATGLYGTALAPIYYGLSQGKKFHVYVDETRPLLQGSRITAFELYKADIPATLICDNMAAMVMKQGKVDAVIVGADRIAANGDTANKIGTYGLALIAKAHQVPFYVAAPFSTFDLDLPDGSGIPIEERHEDEISIGFGKRTAPEGVAVFNPAFDVTPHELIKGIITEKGVLRTPLDLRG